MSGFLSRLAGRVLAAEATIRPRLPTLFEPVSPPARADEQIVPAMPAGRSALTAPPEVGVEESPVLSGTLEPPSILAAQSSHNGKAERAGIAPNLETPEAQGENTHSNPKGYEPRHRETPQFPVENTPQRPIQELERTEPQRVGNSTTRSLLPAKDNSSRAPFRGPVPVEAKVIHHTALPPVIEEKSPPTINVTIGRIEVRAIHRPEPQRIPASPQQLPQPRLSLDDYLAQRRQGRR